MDHDLRVVTAVARGSSSGRLARMDSVVIRHYGSSRVTGAGAGASQSSVSVAGVVVAAAAVVLVVVES